VSGGQYFDDIPPFSGSFEMAWYVVRWMWQTRRLSITLVGCKDHCRVWLCEDHAPRERNLALCACGQPAAWWHRDWRGWTCLDHAPAEVD
jgi:hypothetical protein